VSLIMRLRSPRVGLNPTMTPDPQMTQRCSPRNLSRRSISLSNAVVFEASVKLSRSSQPYPTGGLFIERGSGKADSDSMMWRQQREGGRRMQIRHDSWANYTSCNAVPVPLSIITIIDRSYFVHRIHLESRSEASWLTK